MAVSPRKKLTPKLSDMVAEDKEAHAKRHAHIVAMMAAAIEWIRNG